jgi:hypothetical protein
MKEYKFDDLDNDGYEIVIPKEVVKNILIHHYAKTFYWTVGLFSFIVGFLTGVIV